MHTPPVRLLRAVECAARLRSSGQSWQDTALELNRAVGTVRHWPYQFREYWQQLTVTFQDIVTTDAASEAVGVLRMLLRSGDDRIRRDAAKEILHARGPAVPPSEPTPNSDLHRFADYLEGLSDEELHASVGARGAIDDVGPEGRVGGADAAASA